MRKSYYLIAVVLACAMLFGVASNIVLAYIPVSTGASVTQAPVSSNGYTAKWLQEVNDGSTPYTVKAVFGDGSSATLTYQTAQTYNWIHIFNGPYQTYYQTFSVTDAKGQKDYAYTSVVKR